MKLKVIESMNLDEDKTTKKKSSEKEPTVYKNIAKRFGSEIPIMKDLSKHEKSIKINFNVRESINKMARIMVSKCDKFKEFSEVDRAAYYLGMMIMWHQFLGKVGNYKDKLMYDNIIEVGEIEEKYQILNECTVQFDKIIQYFRDKIISEAIMLEKIEAIIVEIPSDLHKIAEKLFNDLWLGSTTKKVLFKKLAGRPRLRKVK